MRTRLVVPSELWMGLQRHLLKDHDEHLAFFLAGTATTAEARILLARDLMLIEDHELEGGLGLEPKLDTLLRVMNAANRAGLALVEAHNHPGADRVVTFSSIDLDGQREMAAYLTDALPGRPYGAIVLGERSIDGLIWSSGRAERLPLQEVRILGERCESICAPRGARRRSAYAPSARVHRQVLALGEVGQQELHMARVAIVGAGGLGSAVGQQLAHLGVGHVVVIDDDAVEETNLHRLVGATPADVGRPKAEVVSSFMRAISPGMDVVSMTANLRSRMALDVIKAVDVIFGCVDTDSGRMILNEVALAYLLPYIDCGVGIEVRDGTITEAGGKVSVWSPGRPCSVCCRDFNRRIAAEELESYEEREFRRTHGYVEGAHVPEPAVVSLNGAVASLAVTEFLALITGVWASHHYTYYDLLEGRAGRRLVRRNENCAACAVQGIGELANVERYARLALPEDIPTPEQA